MDMVTLGAALNGAKAQTEDYVSSHFKGGANINIENNPDGTQTINASGEVSSEDTVARGEIADHEADENNPHNVTAEQIGIENKSASSGGTDDSLVTTGDKYNWNNKATITIDGKKLVVE